jgi:hypothetical protein
VSEPVECNKERGEKSRELDEIDKPIDAIVGLVLNLSAITEITEQEQQEGGLQIEAAKTEESSSDRSVAGKEDSIAVVADNPERDGSLPAEDVDVVPDDHDLGIKFDPAIPSHALQSIESIAESSKQDSEHVQSFEEEIYQSSVNHRSDGELIPDQLIRGDSVSETNVDSNPSSPSGTAVSDTYSESFCSQSIHSKNV